MVSEQYSIHVLHHSQWEVSKFVTSLFTLRSESCAFSLVKIMFVFMCLWANFHLLFVCSGLVMEGYLFKKKAAMLLEVGIGECVVAVS